MGETGIESGQQRMRIETEKKIHRERQTGRKKKREKKERETYCGPAILMKP